MGEIVRSERLRLGMTVEEAARGIGISTSLLRRLESGACELRASEIVRIATFYGCSPDYLLGLSEDRSAGLVDR